MKAVLQRVAHAQVVVDDKLISKIDKGFLVLLGVDSTDTKDDADILSKKISGMRVFEDENGKMNLSLTDIGGSLLVISQFTLLADCRKGRRPSFVGAGAPDMANELYEYFCKRIIDDGITDVKKGVFGADMKVSLLNDGPVTILLDSKELKK